MRPPCGKEKAKFVSVRDQVLDMYRRLVEAGQKNYAVQSLAKHRLAQCLHASECGRVCKKFVKAPGVIAYCVDIESSEKTELYTALENPDFECPEGLF